MSKSTRCCVFVLLVVSFVLTILTVYLECSGARNSTTLIHAGIVIIVAATLLGFAAYITATSNMRSMAIWPGMCAVFSYAASLLIFNVTSTGHYHGMAAQLSLAALVVTGILQLVYLAVWYVYIRLEPDNSSPWTPGHP